MKTNTFIFNFINPSRLVYENQPKPRENLTITTSGTASEAPVTDISSQAKRATAETEEMGVLSKLNVDMSMARLRYVKATENYDKTETEYNDKKSLLDLAYKREKEGYPVSKDALRVIKKDIESAKTNFEAAKAEKETSVQEVRNAGSALSAYRKKQKDASVVAEAPQPEVKPEKKREVVKADPKTKKTVASLISNKDNALVEFAKTADLSKGWIELNKEFLQILKKSGLGIAHVKALQDVLFEGQARNRKNTDGMLGSTTLAKLQEKLDVKPTAPVGIPGNEEEPLMALAGDWNTEPFWKLYSTDTEQGEGGQAVAKREPKKPESKPTSKPSAANQLQQELIKADEEAERQALAQNKAVEPEWIDIAYDKSRIKSNVEALKKGIEKSYENLRNVIGYLKNERDEILEIAKIKKSWYEKDLTNKYKGIFDNVSKDIKTAYDNYSELNKTYKTAREENKIIQESLSYSVYEKGLANKASEDAWNKRKTAIKELNKTIWSEIRAKQKELTAWLEKHDTIANDLTTNVPVLENPSVANAINDKNKTKVFDNFAQLKVGCNPKELNRLEIEIKSKNNGNYTYQDLLNYVNDYILSKNAIALANLVSTEKLSTYAVA